MIIAARYSFNGGAAVVKKKFPHLLREVERAISEVDAEACKTKKSKEKTMPGKLLYSPVELNKAFAIPFKREGWANRRVVCEYGTEHYTGDYVQRQTYRDGFRDMDFVKEKLGVEIQFGKYSFMVYNVAAKMTIFRNLGHIDAGIEIVPVKQMAARGQMSSGVSYFEQFVWDLEQRGTADIDVPVLILGIDRDASAQQQVAVTKTEAG